MKGLCVGCGRPSDGWGPWCWCGIECRFWSKVEQDGDCWIWTAHQKLKERNRLARLERQGDVKSS